MDVIGTSYIFFVGLILSCGFFIDVKKRVPYFVLLAVVFILIRLYFPPYIFSDYENYIFIKNELTDKGLFELGPLGPFEFLSKAMFLISNNLTSNSEYSIYPVYYFIFIAVMVLFAVISLKFPLHHRNIILVISIYSPLLLFVTLRASIPYLIVTFLFLRNFKVDIANIALFLLALAFHISTALIILPVLLYKLIGRENDIKLHKHIAIFLSTFVLSALLKISQSFAGAFINDTFLLEGNLAKYRVFFDPKTISTSAFHQLYFVLIFMLGALCILTAGVSTNKEDLKKFLALSSIFFVLSISPIIAFRFSIFFTLPLLLRINILPTLKLHRPFSQFVVFASIYGLFIIHFYYVLQPAYR